MVNYPRVRVDPGFLAQLGGGSTAKALVEAEQLYRRALRAVESLPAAESVSAATAGYT